MNWDSLMFILKKLIVEFKLNKQDYDDKNDNNWILFNFYFLLNLNYWI